MPSPPSPRSAPAFVCSPADLLAVVPYQLGFHPQRSAVLVVLSSARRVAGMARFDADVIPPPAGSPDRACIDALLRQAAGGVVVVGFDAPDCSTAPVRAWLTRESASAGIPVVAHLVVTGGTWRDVDCADSTCCPPAGRPVPSASRVPVIAEWVSRGVAPLPDRVALAEQFEPWPLAARVGDAVRRATERPDPVIGARAWEAILDPLSRHPPVHCLSAETLAAAAVTLRNVNSRDALIWWLAPDLAPPDQPGSPVTRFLGDPPWARRRVEATPAGGVGPAQEAHVGPAWKASDPLAGDAATHVLRCRHRLADLVRCLPRPEQVTPLSVLAGFAWWWGDGPLAAVALERALSIDPAHSLSGVLLRMVRLGVRPRGPR